MTKQNSKQQHSNDSNIILFLRSVLFFIGTVFITCTFGAGLVFTLLLPTKWRFKCIHFVLNSFVAWFKFAGQINYEVEGLENIPTDRHGVMLAKHQSAWETFFLPTLFPRFCYIAKRELLWIPFFGWGFAASQPITINRSNRSSAMQQVIQQGQMRHQQGRWILVYPEGTRVAPGQVGHYKLGGARLAIATHSPVVPIAHNAGRFWSKRKFIKRPGTVKVVIGPVIESEGRTPEEVLALAKDWIEATMMRIDRGIDKPTG